MFFHSLFAVFGCVMPIGEVLVHKITEHHDECAGMVRQEMNHVFMHSMINREAQKYGHYPGWVVRLFKRGTRALPVWLVRAVFGASESCIMSFSSPIVKEFIGPRWAPPFSCWAMHLLEESEHTWSSVREMADASSFWQR